MDYERLLAVKQEAQARLRAIPGVHAVAIGPKVVAGRPTAEAAILVYLVCKKPLSDVPPEEQIPAEIGGFKTDVIEQEIPRLHETAQGGLQIETARVDGSGTLGCIALSNDKSKVYALTCYHVVQPARWQKPNLTVTQTAFGGGTSAIKVTFGGFIRDGELVIVHFTPVTAGQHAYQALYGVSSTDTTSSVSTNVAGQVTALGVAGFTASPAGTNAITINPGLGYVCSCDVLGHYEYAKSDLRASITGMQVTFSGKVSGDLYGVYVVMNAAGPSPTSGVFTPLVKAMTLIDVANAVATSISTMGIAGITASPTDATVQIKGVTEFECEITSDVRVGQPCLCSACSKCCGDRIGVVTKARRDVDTALIQLDSGLDYLAEMDGIDGWVTGVHPVTQTDITPGPYVVKKSGSTSGVTTNGNITALNKDGFFHSEVLGDRQYAGAMDITSTGGNAFSKPGDSGSAVLNSNNEVVGILFGGSDSFTMATPIQSITSLFGITIATATAAGQHQTVPGPPINTLDARVRVPALARPSPAGARSLQMRALEVKREMTEIPAGKQYAIAVQRHAPEVQALINSRPRVAAVWRRWGGPRMIEAIAGMVQGGEKTIPSELEGKPLAECIARIQEALLRYASPPLADGLRRYAPRLAQFAGLTYAELLDRLRTESGA